MALHVDLAGRGSILQCFVEIDLGIVALNIVSVHRVHRR